MVLAGIDPSFTRTGVSILTDKELIVTSFSHPIGDKTFQNVWRASEELSTEIANYLKSFNVTDVISEVPPPSGSFSSGLFCLDSLLFSKIEGNVYNVNPNYLQHIHGKRNYTKTESVELATSLIEEIKKSGVKVKLRSKRLNHDEAESVIFLSRLFVITGVKANVASVCEKLKTPKEKILILREVV